MNVQDEVQAYCDKLKALCEDQLKAKGEPTQEHDAPATETAPVSVRDLGSMWS